MFKTLIIAFSLIAHPVHVSLMSIDYDRNDEAFKVFVKVFYDDFLIDSGIADLNEIIENGISGYGPPEIGEANEYFNEKLMILVNDRQVKGDLLTINLADGELSVNLLFNTGRRINTVTVRSQIMTDLYDDQANMVILKVHDFEEGVKLTPEKKEQTFKIK
jgi:hypothetical protein